MKTQFDYSKVKVSWTKYDIVHITDLMESKETFIKFYEGHGGVNEPILRAFVGVKDISDPIPNFWDTVFLWDRIDRLYFAVFLFAYSNSEQTKKLIEPSMISPLRGKLVLPPKDKAATNWRSLLVESGLAQATERRKSEVYFDGSRLLNSAEIGATFKQALDNLIQINSSDYEADEFYPICFQNKFHAILGMTEEQFQDWLEGHVPEAQCVRSLAFDKFLCFDDRCELDFHSSQDKSSRISKEIYFLGENGDGKTVLLLALFSAFKYYTISAKRQITEISDLIQKVKETNIEGCDNLERKYTLNAAPEFTNFFAYGTHRGRYSTETDKSTYERYGFMTLFNNDMTLPDPSDWLAKQFLSQNSRPELSRKNLEKVLSLLLENKVQIKLNDQQIIYYEKGYPLTLKELSEGYRSIIIFVCDLLIKLSQSCAAGHDVFQEHGVVLIDEIDQHLHPRWQLTIVKKLRNLFPNIQFIMTTHSPVIVLGSSEDALFFRVERQEGSTTVSEPYFRSSMDKMMLNTLITSSLFNLDTAAMSPEILDSDTSNDMISSQIHKAIREKVEKERREGKWHYNENDVQTMINSLLSDL